MARVAAPAAFLLAVTVALLLVRSGLRAGERPAGSSGAVVAPAGGQTVSVRAGDTLERIAARHGTSVAELLRLNPGIDPIGLRAGRRIRVK